MAIKKAKEETKWPTGTTFFINETGLNFIRDQTSQQLSIDYPVTKRYLNQISFDLQNHRALYPYKTTFLAEQGNGFMKLGFTGNYYFNYINIPSS